MVLKCRWKKGQLFKNTRDNNLVIIVIKSDKCFP